MTADLHIKLVVTDEEGDELEFEKEEGYFRVRVNGGKYVILTSADADELYRFLEG